MPRLRWSAARAPWWCSALAGTPFQSAATASLPAATFPGGTLSLVEELSLALEATDQDLIADPLHIRADKPLGATTRPPGLELLTRYPAFDSAHAHSIIEAAATHAGRRFGTGPAAFAWLAEA